MDSTVMHNTRLCLASPVFFPTYGGAQLRYLRYLPGLRRHGADVRVFTGTATPLDFTPEDVYEEWTGHRVGRMLPVDRIDGTPVHRVRLPDRKGVLHRWLFYRSLCRFCRNPEFRPDVLQLLGTIRVGSLPWIRQVKGLGIATLYSVTTASKVTRRKEGFDARLFKFRTIFNTMDCVVTNSSHLRELILEMGVTSRVEAIPNGVDLARFSPDGTPGRREEIRAGLGIGAQDRVVMAVGAIMSRKGSDLLVESFGRLAGTHPATHLVFVGPRQRGDEPHHREFQDRLDRLVAASGAPERVHFVDLTADVPDYLRAADICVLPSRREGLPNSVLEAMACGKPVVMTPFEGLSEDLGLPGTEYLLADHEPESLAGRIGQLLDDPGLAAEIAGRGLDWVRSKMSLEDSVARYARLYEELAAARRR
jgi:glycosyltransferase involved in cell wall biosynthesis